MNQPRPLLPQTNQMQTFSFAPPNLGLGDAKKNYVFVDEHNRHKRLKVMRACEGCRRRKIKCDAATTNSWPCAACVRLKLQCIPPTVNYNRTHSSGGQGSGLERVLDFDSSGGSGDESEYIGHGRPMVQKIYQLGSGSDMLNGPHSPYGSEMGSFTQRSPYSEKSELHYHLPHANITSMPMSGPEASSYHPHGSFHLPSVQQVQGVDGGEQWSREDTPININEVLGELKIDETGIAPYIYQQKKTLAEAPALEEYEMALPAAPTGSGATVRIPPALMPEEEQAMEYFDIFFNSIHPYVPVISKAYFYQQWHTSRRSISPLLLEAIFACAGRMSTDPAQGAQWLALASKHEDCFMDVPRLSTIQALLILLKAREAAPKRGYYYRSWMTVKTLIAMAKDLELDEHYADHQAGRNCGSDPTECLVKTRIWQNIFVCEMMVGGPQGRFDLSVNIDTVDINIPQAPPGTDDAEYQISRNFTYFTRTIRNTRMLHEVYCATRKDKDWGKQAGVTAFNSVFPKWLEELPTDMQIHYPPDGSPPWLPSHFVANMHVHHHLSVITLHRPQLMVSSSFAAGGSWKEHMLLSYSSAKSLCRLQEAILQTYGVDGLLCMQRGINFAIYSILVCTMLHLVSVTSPDPDFNCDAKEYFTRHMRILENCISQWPMPDLQAQIQSLREAFSTDTNKPFELKMDFPFSGPGARMVASPSADMQYRQQQAQQLQFTNRPLTPPISADNDDHKDGSHAAASLAMMATGQGHRPSLPSNAMADESITWNPTRIFEYGAKSPKETTPSVRKIANPRRSQWNTAFGTPPSSISGATTTMGQPSPTIYTPTSTVGSHELPHLHDAMQQQQQQQQQQYSIPSNMPPVSQQMQPPSQQVSFAPSLAGHAFVSPTMWQDTVASTYGANYLKRGWSDDPTVGPAFFDDQQQVKRSR